MLVDIECDSKHLDHVVRMLKREVQSVNYATTLCNDGKCWNVLNIIKLYQNKTLN